MRDMRIDEIEAVLRAELPLVAPSRIARLAETIFARFIESSSTSASVPSTSADACCRKSQTTPEWAIRGSEDRTNSVGAIL